MASNVMNETRQGLNDLVERCLDADRSRDPSPVFSRHEVREMVIQALKIAHRLEPTRAQKDYGDGLAFVHSAPQRALNGEALRVAINELERGFRGPA